MGKVQNLAIAFALVFSVGLSAQAKSSKKQQREEARKTCLSKDPELKGKALKKCVFNELKAK